ncbi:gas vesicle protein [Goodfellowiella coeruleoviolacea]|uniref:Gas vesicle protein n=1 Tax=Goodfellowiella coeruleoviolacea TaxID=334858 RepID=A0AAE3GI41_9PSEU|nr:gas vesicle protein [Goodfellowiella coeruleoviolacea]MCP2168048.1 Gas vesicle protein [Goodfellowiella coeruleoviolacea]
MTQPAPWQAAPSGGLAQPHGQAATTNLADILERVLEKGVVIAGDIKISLLDIELLTIKLRLLVASVDKAKEMGIDWWEHDPTLSSRANTRGDTGSRDLAEENRRLRERVEELESRTKALDPSTSDNWTGRGTDMSTSDRVAPEEQR